MGEGTRTIAVLALAVGVAAFATAAVTLVVALRLARSAASVARAPDGVPAAVQRLSEDVRILSSAVSRFCEDAQEDRVNGQARRVLLRLTDVYPGGDGLPGAAVVLVVNHSSDPIHQVSLWYRPDMGEAQRSDVSGRSLTISPHVQYAHTFAVPHSAGPTTPDQFELRFTDPWQRRWRRVADAAAPQLIGPDEEDGTAPA